MHCALFVKATLPTFHSFRIGAASLVLFALSGCLATPTTSTDPLMNQLDGPMAQLQFDTKQLHQRLLKLTANKSCNQDQQCKIMGIGSKPCGGPEQFLVYSENHTDEKMLTITNDRYSKLKKEQQSRLGVMGICQQLVAPTPRCQAQTCVLLE